MAITVREVAIEEIEDLLPIWDEINLGAATLDKSALITRIEISQSSESLKLVAAWDGNRAVGIACISIADVGVWAESLSLQVSGLHVLKNSRHRGVAKAILNSALSYADKWGCVNIMASVPPNEREASRFFARLGFAPISTRRITDTAVLRRKISAEPSRLVAQRIRRRTQSLLSGEIKLGPGVNK